MKELERLLWEEIGTKEDYDKKYSSIPLGEFVRSITGLKNRKYPMVSQKHLQNILMIIV